MTPVPARQVRDWIESFLTLTEGIPSPEIFRKWTAISILAGALQRRVWVRTAQSILYPNLYTVLVSPPGVGKSQAISRAQDLWSSINSLHVAPNSVTKAALLDCLEGSAVRVTKPDKTFQIFHALNVASSEFGVLVPAHDLDFLSVLNDIYDCPSKFRENRRHRARQLDIDYPLLNILAGTQPAYLASLLPEEAWGMGFTSRLILIYSAQNIRVPLFAETDEFTQKRQEAEQTRQFKALKSDLERMTTLYGQFAWEPEAKKNLEAWANAGLPPIPINSRMQHYNARRVLHMLKLCMVSAIARDDELCITLADVNRARDWLLEAEERMPDVFRDMAGKSDKQVIDDLYQYIWRLTAATRDEKGNLKPIHVTRLIQFLQTRVPSEKVMRIIELCVRSEMLQIAGKDLYLPGLKDTLPSVE